LERKDEVFEHFRSLVLRLNNEHPNCLKAIHNDNGTEFRKTYFQQGVDQQFFCPVCASIKWSCAIKEPHSS
jgi:hypothetical protein